MGSSNPKQYHLGLSKQAQRVLHRLARQHLFRIARAIDSLAVNPRPLGSMKIKGGQDVYRLGVGAYRIVYQIKDPELRVLVIRIGHRRDVYRNL